MIAWDGDAQVDVDRAGADYRWFATANSAICRSTCAGESACQAWTHYAGQCYLKDAVPGFTPLTGATSGIKVNRTTGWEYDYDRPGAGYKTFEAASMNVCRDTCAGEDRCQAFTTRASASGATCWLKDEQPNPVAKSGGYRSAAKRGTRAHRYWKGGHVFHTWTYGTASPELCQSDCARRSNCEAWTYRASALGRSPQCWLYDTPGTLTATANNYVSGAKGDEFR